MVDIETRLAAALRSWPMVRAAWLFGSEADGRAGPLSDVDVAILGGAASSLDDRAALTVELSRAAGRACDLACVENASPVLGMEIVRARRRFYTVDADAADAADQWEDFALRRYLGTAHLRRTVNAEIAAQLRAAARQGTR